MQMNGYENPTYMYFEVINVISDNRPTSLDESLQYVGDNWPTSLDESLQYVSDKRPTSLDESLQFLESENLFWQIHITTEFGTSMQIRP